MTPRVRLLLAIIFVVAGIVVAATHTFETWAGRELSEAAPSARKVVPAPAKKVLHETRELLPVYGATSVWLARKSASVIYFGAVGVFILALRKRKPTSLLGTLLVTVISGVAMSAVIEIVEFPEELADEIFDLACGALGGVLSGLAAWPFVRRLRAPKPTADL